MESRSRGEPPDEAADQRCERDQRGRMRKTGDSRNLHGENATGFQMDITCGSQPQDSRTRESGPQRLPCGGCLPETRHDSRQADSPPRQRQAGNQAEYDNIYRGCDHMK